MRKFSFIITIALMLITTNVLAQEASPSTSEVKFPPYLFGKSVEKTEKEKPYHFSFEPDLCYYGKLTGDIQSDIDGIEGTKIKPSDLDIEKTSFIPAGRIWVRVGKRGRIILSYLESERKGKETISDSLTYKNATFSSGELVSSVINLKTGTLAYQYNFLQKKHINLGILAGAQYLYLDTKLSSSANSEQQIDIEGSLPVLGLTNKIGFGRHLDWETQVSGAASRFESTDTTLLDTHSKLTVYINRYAGLGIGYRYLKINTDGICHDHLTYNGPTAHFTLRF